MGIPNGASKIFDASFFAQTYYSWNNSGKTYPIATVTRLMNGTKVAGLDTNGVGARTITLDQAIDRAKFIETSARWNAEAQYNNSIEAFDFTIGLNYQLDMPQSEGTYLSDILVDGVRQKIASISQIGGSFQLERDVLENLRAVVAGRVDNHDNFGTFFAPKAGLVFKALDGSFRVTYGRGINTPTVLNQVALIPLGSLGAYSINLRGNNKGFELSDGSKIDPLRVEIIDTYELGYKGVPLQNLFVDINAYYGSSKDFISPAIPLGYVKSKGFVGATKDSEYVYSYVNYGKVNTYGLDLGLNYTVNEMISIGINYSWLKSDLDTSLLDESKTYPGTTQNRKLWDVNGDKFVTPNEIKLNTPQYKGSVTVNVSQFFVEKLFAAFGMRFISQYDFVSGVHYAGEFLPGQKEGDRAKVGKDPSQPISATNSAAATFDQNLGPLGGFVTFDVTFGYRVTSSMVATISVSNLFNSKQREMVASPLIKRLVVGEIRYSF